MAINTPPGFAAKGRIGRVTHLYGPSHQALYPIPRYIYQADINAMHDLSTHTRFTLAHPWPAYRFGPRPTYVSLQGRNIQRITGGASFEPTSNAPTLTGVAPG